MYSRSTPCATPMNWWSIYVFTSIAVGSDLTLDLRLPSAPICERHGVQANEAILWGCEAEQPLVDSQGSKRMDWDHHGGADEHHLHSGHPVVLPCKTGFQRTGSLASMLSDTPTISSHHLHPPNYPHHLLLPLFVLSARKCNECIWQSDDHLWNQIFFIRACEFSMCLSLKASSTGVASTNLLIVLPYVFGLHFVPTLPSSLLLFHPSCHVLALLAPHSPLHSSSSASFVGLSSHCHLLFCRLPNP